VYGFGGELLAEYAASAAPASPQKEYGYRDAMRNLIAIIVILFSVVSSGAQQGTSRARQWNMHLRIGMPGVYITLERVGQLKSPDPGDDKERVWLRLHNNTRSPIRLDMGGVPSSEYGDAALFFDEFLGEELTFRHRCHSCTSNMLAPGKSVIFSVPRADLGETRAIRIRFSYGWEDWGDVIAGREPEHYVYFHSSRLPKGLQQMTK